MPRADLKRAFICSLLPSLPCFFEGTAGLIFYSNSKSTHNRRVDLEKSSTLRVGRNIALRYSCHPKKRSVIAIFKESLIKCSLREMEQIRSLLEMAAVKMAAGVAELR
jgi:hypothetical protein